MTTESTTYSAAPVLSCGRLLKLPEVAELLRSSIKTVRRAIDEGKLRSIKIRGLRLVRLDDLNAYVNEAARAA